MKRLLFFLLRIDLVIAVFIISLVVRSAKRKKIGEITIKLNTCINPQTKGNKMGYY